MSRLWLTLQLGTIFTSALAATVFAQGGCNKDVHYGLVHCVDNGQETEVDDDTCTDVKLGYLCVQGYGQCTDGTVYHTANAGYDPSCGPPTCCNGQITCVGRQVCGGILGGGCSCQYASPIIVDTTGRGFHLTPATGGVIFDIAGNGHPIKIAWTAPGSSNAFLALDRNHNGQIDGGKELFGNFTAQPESDQPNGFLALAEFDKPENGGNSDGIIDTRDAVFSQLLLWIDENHDGISQPDELHSLPALGVFSLGLHYRDDEHFDDQYGNWFHYQASVNPDKRDGMSQDGRVMYDVFFEVAQNQSQPSFLQSQGPNVRARTQWELALIDDRLDAPLNSFTTGCSPEAQTFVSGGKQ